MEWIKITDKTPSKGSYLVTFTIEILGRDTPFIEKELYAEGFFDPQKGWCIENRYIRDCRYSQEYISPRLKVTQWMPLPKPPIEEV